VQVGRLQQVPKLLQTYSCIPNDAGHRECMDWIVAGNRQDSRSIRHDDVRALAQNSEPRFLQRGDSSKMVDSR
jgi:hypothetical protein